MTTRLKAKPPAQISPGHCKMMLYGRAGVGKTFLALSFPACFYIDTESGARLPAYAKRLEDSGGAYLGHEEGSTDFPSVIEQVQALATERHAYKTVVLDSITKLYQLAIAAEQERLGDRDAFGASKKPAVAYMRRLVNWVSRLDMNVLFVAHQISEWGLVAGQRQEIGTAPDVWDKLSYELDLTLRIEHPSRTLRTATVIKSRLSGFPQHDRITLQDGDKDLGYTELAARYGVDYIDAPAVPIELCTGEQVAEIERLTSILKLEDDILPKALAKASADTISDLSKDQAAKLTAWLAAKLR